MDADAALVAAREWSLDEMDADEVLDALAAEVELLRAAVTRAREAANVTFNDPMVAPASAATAERILRALDGET